MPRVSGSLINGWALVDVLVSVSHQRRVLLERNNFKAPASVHVRALIDTGATLSGFSPRVFRELDLTPVTTMSVVTPSTPPSAPHDANLYDVSLALVAGGAAHPFPDMRVMEADCWLPNEGIEALIGMDILTRCFFQLMGPEGQFVIAF
jgi:hypothetical protein